MSGKRRRSKPDADRGLARENFRELNRTFYRMKPHAYLRRRLTSLLLWLGAPTGLEQILKAGIEYESIVLKWDEDPDEEQLREEAEERQRYAAVESEVLLHHASETVLRFYLAHCSKAPSPWLDLSRETDYRAFKKKVANLKKRLQRGEEGDRIAFAFYGATDRKQWTPTPEETRWEAGRENIAKFLDFFASIFLASESYNAAKHGLAVMGGEPEISVGGRADGPFLTRSGPAIQYLAVRSEPGSGLSRWAELTKWIVLGRAVTMIWVASDLAEALIEIGRARYTGQMPEAIRLFETPGFAEVMEKTTPKQEAGIPGVIVEQMAMHLVYDDEPSH